MTDLGVYQTSMGSLLGSLVDRTPGASHAVLASVDGLPIAISTGLPKMRAEQLAGIGAGLLSIAHGTGRCMATGSPTQVVVEMSEGVLLATPVAAEVSLTVLAAATCDREKLGYEIGVFTAQVGPLLETAS